MTRINVTSTSIRRIGYDDKLAHLEIEFHSGRRYRYTNVPKNTHIEFLNARSIGNFFHSRIRPVFEGIELPPLEQ